MSSDKSLREEGRRDSGTGKCRSERVFLTSRSTRLFRTVGNTLKNTDMDTSGTQCVYNCDVRTSTVTYPIESVDVTSETTRMWDEPAPAWGDDDNTATTEGGDATAADGAGGEAAPVPVILPADREKAPKPVYTLHWVKPLVLNYDYLYDYRQNYYNDYIDYLDKRQRGIYREVPRAQEWAERALRTYNTKISPKSGKHAADMHMISGLRTTSRYYSYHTRAYYSLKYMKIL